VERAGLSFYYALRVFFLQPDFYCMFWFEEPEFTQVKETPQSRRFRADNSFLLNRLLWLLLFARGNSFTFHHPSHAKKHRPL
jgi:hypothetical protein